jgi:hypothetical protein
LSGHPGFYDALGLGFERTPGGRFNLYLNLTFAREQVLRRFADYSDMSTAKLSQVLSRYRGLRSKRMRIAGRRDERWWCLDVTELCR